MEWRYLRRGHVAHAIEDCDTELRYAPSYCGREPQLGGYWYGTGNQDEYEMAALLPKCYQCQGKVGRHVG